MIDRDRGGGARWDAAAAGGTFAPLVAADESAPSWREKLQAVQRLLAGEAGGSPSGELVAGCAGYLPWGASGAIQCAEDGNHHRPNHHAHAAMATFEALERLPQGSAARAAARSVHPRLPSFSEAYTNSEPLTRIRDIAHGRGDDGRCKAIRHEIKHTIQNKLHRCAGPEDLIATERMLERLTHGDFPEAFVHEFRVFYRELKEFFNATGLEDRLGGLQHTLGGDAPDAIGAFLGAKHAADNDGSGDPSSALSALEQLQRAREVILSEMAGLQDVSVLQSARLADIGLEAHAFVLLSRVVGAAEAGRADAGALCRALRYAAQAISASSTRAGEAAHVAELAATGDAARAGAAARELAGALADDAEGLFGPAARVLGPALGVEQRQVDIYVESDVRSSVVYSLGRLADLLLKDARAASGAVEVDCLVAGEAVGVLTCVKRLAPGCVPAAEGPHICVVAIADGDEEVGVAGGSVTGVVLAHEMPHLSHLALRARQEGIVAATCEDAGRLEAIRALEGMPVRITASADGVSVEPASVDELEQARSAWLAVHDTVIGAGADAREPTQPTLILPPVDESLAGQAVMGDAIDARTCGAKAAACARLDQLAQASGETIPFSAPSGGVLPFGSMRMALDESACAALDDALARAETAEGAELDEVCEALQAIAGSARPTRAALVDIISALSTSSLAVRSSANVEDLAGMSAAGLYDSLLNVPTHVGGAIYVTAVSEAVATVWASLYTRRAVLARRAAGVPQASAAMAVLLQPLVDAAAAFILCTSNPMTGEAGECYVELAEGLGETLASGNVRGTPCRLTVRENGGVVTLAEGSLVTALVPASLDDGGGLVEAAADGSVGGGLLADAETREELARRIAVAGRTIREAEGGGPQDVEGAIDADGNVWVVQARPAVVYTA